MKRYGIYGLAGAVVLGFFVGSAWADHDGDGKEKPIAIEIKDHPLSELWSGYHYAKPETRAVQDDDFQNPASLWWEVGEQNWSNVDGEAGKSCSTCHNDAAASMKGVSARYPVYFEPWKKLINIEQRINLCRTQFMKAAPWKWESNELLGMTVYVGFMSRGISQSIKLDDKTKPFWEKGKDFYYKRRGQLDMACAHCHEVNPGGQLRSNILSQGQINGFPTYRLKWQGVGSLHRRFSGCNKQVRSKPFKKGSDEYTNLELYVKWRGQGLPVETPAVRN